MARPLAATLGTIVEHSDVTRKVLAGVPPTEHRPAALAAGLYDAASTERTYDSLLDRAREAIRDGRGAVVDATFGRRRWRDAFRSMAREEGAPFVVVHVRCPHEEVLRRMETRRADPLDASDADAAVYQAARAGFEEPEELEARELVEHRSGEPVEAALGDLAARLADQAARPRAA